MSEISCLVSMQRLERLWGEGLVEPISWEEKEKLKEGDTILIPRPDFIYDGRLRILRLSERPAHSDGHLKIKVGGGCDTLVAQKDWPGDYGLLLAERWKRGEVCLDGNDFRRGIYRKMDGGTIPVTKIEHGHRSTLYF